MVILRIFHSFRLSIAMIIVVVSGRISLISVNLSHFHLVVSVVFCAL